MGNLCVQRDAEVLGETPAVSPGGEDPSQELNKFASAVAHFKRYEVGVPVRDLWEKGHEDGFAYWETDKLKGQRKATGDSLENVSKQARAGFLDSISGGITVESLAEGLGRAITRVKIVDEFKPHVAPAVSNATTKLGKAGVVAVTKSSPELVDAASRKEVLLGAVKQLKISGLIDEKQAAAVVVEATPKQNGAAPAKIGTPKVTPKPNGAAPAAVPAKGETPKLTPKPDGAAPAKIDTPAAVPAAPAKVATPQVTPQVTPASNGAAPANGHEENGDDFQDVKKPKKKKK